MPKVREDSIPLKELILHLESTPSKESIPFKVPIPFKEPISFKKPNPFKESIPYENDSFGESNRFLQNVLKMAKESESRLNRNRNRLTSSQHVSFLHRYFVFPKGWARADGQLATLPSTLPTQPFRKTLEEETGDFRSANGICTK